jgi:magnesium chelatase accessory protein
MAAAPLDWSTDRARWPHTEHSRFADAGGVHWHVQDMGHGDALLLIHGTGASTHSWAGLMPLLARRYRVVAVDLPGHGFSTPGPGHHPSLRGMARAAEALLAVLDVDPALVIGHSAGAAVLARMCLDDSIQPRALVSINGALLPLRGLAGQFFAPAAKLLAGLPMVPGWFARRAHNHRLVERLIRDTGSSPPAASVDCYQRLMCTPGHVAAALDMMANWDLDLLARQLSGLEAPLHLVACANDRTVPPVDAERLARLLRVAHLHRVPALGHLGHEENPALFDALVAEIDRPA